MFESSTFSFFAIFEKKEQVLFLCTAQLRLGTEKLNMYSLAMLDGVYVILQPIFMEKSPKPKHQCVFENILLKYMCQPHQFTSLGFGF